jgi:hypothetical protein
LNDKMLAFRSLTFVLLVMFAARSLQAQQYVFRSVDVPGATSTLPECNNNLGQIVGNFYVGGFNSNTQNFLLSQGVFKPVPGYPGGAVTGLIAVNPSGGKYVGWWQDTSGNTHGFYLSGGKYISFDYPGAVWTEAIDINDAGTIVGLYFDGTADHGFKLQSGKFTNIDPPGAAGSFAETVNNSGQVVGMYSLTSGQLASGVQGYLLTSGSYTTINYPGATQTAAIGLNSSGQMVGWYLDSGGAYHAFADLGGTFSTVDYPGAAQSQGIEINDEGQILAVWYGPAPDFYDQHGYIANPIPGTSSRDGHGQSGKTLGPR